jgi:4-hydroxy-3-methylbut-2-en-1-yl diphosphate reductase
MASNMARTMAQDHVAASRPKLRILVAAPRGFCAGVDRAIKIVELALKKYGAPVYVRHEIVHNRHVVESLKSKGAIFVEELDEIPETSAPVIFSAHGVPKVVPERAEARNMFYLDATCPLVSKVHAEARDHLDKGLEIVLIGHAGHPEVVGTLGQLPPGAATLIETAADARAFAPRDPQRLAYITQTTLSVDDTAAVVAILKERFPAIVGPKKEDICYATTNRQAAVKAIAARCDRLIVVGAPNSSNSLRLVEVAERAGCPKALLVQQASEIPWEEFDGIATLGVTAGASAPELLVTQIIQAFRDRFDAEVESVVTREERIAFNVPRELREAGAG